MQAGQVVLWLATLLLALAALGFTSRAGLIYIGPAHGHALHVLGTAAAAASTSTAGGASQNELEGLRPLQSGLSVPSLTAYQSIKANPSLLDTIPSVVQEFEAAPWLLPPRTPHLPYACVHGFNELLALRSQPAGSYNHTIMILMFSRAWAVMAQNSIYSLVKNGGVRNYVLVTWTQGDLEACADLNLPCANVADMLLEPITPEGPLKDHDFIVMSWIKPAMVVRALQLGYVVMVSDLDLSWAVKPVWDSVLAYIEEAQADGVFQDEWGTVNTGLFVLLPTPASLAFATAWNASGKEKCAKGVSDQNGVNAKDMLNVNLINCQFLCRCYRMAYQLKNQKKRQQVAVVRSFYPSHWMYTQNWCATKSVRWMPRLDPCDWSVLYVHPICTVGSNKQGVLEATGFWFMDDKEGCAPQKGSVSQVPACKPLLWRIPRVEIDHRRCRSFELALVHGGKPAALAAAREGLLPGTEEDVKRKRQEALADWGDC